MRNRFVYIAIFLATITLLSLFFVSSRMDKIRKYDGLQNGRDLSSLKAVLDNMEEVVDPVVYNQLKTTHLDQSCRCDKNLRIFLYRLDEFYVGETWLFFFCDDKLILKVRD